MRIKPDQLKEPIFLANVSHDFLTSGVEYAKAKLFNRETPPLNWEALINYSFPVTNISFGAELALKGLLMFEKNETIRGHSLHSLFKQVSKQNRNEIILKMIRCKEYSNFKILQFNWNEVDPFESEYAQLTKEPFYNNLDRLLELQQYSFIEFRYMYEFYRPEREYLLFDFGLIANLAHQTIDLICELNDRKMTTEQTA